VFQAAKEPSAGWLPSHAFKRYHHKKEGNFKNATIAIGLKMYSRTGILGI